MGEQFYDEFIAPALMLLAKQCEERGMSLVACVEYAPNERGGTYQLTADAGLEMRMLHHCAMTAPNIDAYVIGIARCANERGIDTSHSMILRGTTP